jgi:peptide/histidine transporter 3/4
MELFYTQVSEGMRSLGTSFYLLTMAIGTYLASALNIIVASAAPNDLWVADNPLFGHYDWYFWWVGLAVVSMSCNEWLYCSGVHVL